MGPVAISSPPAGASGSTRRICSPAAFHSSAAATVSWIIWSSRAIFASRSSASQRSLLAATVATASSIPAIDVWGTFASASGITTAPAAGDIVDISCAPGI